jgi:tRNA (guanine6-N2)-methyltransferase
VTTYYTTSFRGIGQITKRELRQKFGNTPTKFLNHKVRDYDILQFDWPDQPTPLLQLGTTEDIFLHLATIPLKGDKNDLKTIQETLERSTIDTAIKTHSQVQGAPRGRTSYRVIVQAQMESWQKYRRSHMQQAVEQNVHQHFSKWRLVADNSTLEFWLQLIGKEAILGLRLTDHTMRHRTYKTVNLPASLRPTIARAVIQLTRIQDDDIFLDPMCGAGTLLIERALAGRHQMLHGGDILKEAVAGTLENFEKKHKPHNIQHWDARKLPLPDQSVNKVATNPPWGRQIGSSSEIQALYTSAFSEIDRVLQTGGIVSVLTSEWDTLKRVLSRTNLTLIDHIKEISVLGRRADIFVLQKFT